jgi:hypothetical protein
MLIKTKGSPAQVAKKAINQRRGTSVLIRYDAGFPNQLYIRGTGANLSWERGIPLKNLGTDQWIWETDLPLTHCEFKVLINDQIFESGENHTLKEGTHIQYTPRF